MGINFNILPLTRSKAAQATEQKEEFQRRLEMYQVIKTEEEKAKNIEQELDNLRKEREAAEKEIEELKKLLDEGEG